MTTAGGLALLICAFIVPPIVLIHRSRISPRRVWLIGLPVMIVANHLGWTVGPVLFSFASFGEADVVSPLGHLYMLLFDASVAAIVTTLLFLAKRRQVRSEAERRAGIREAVEKITADGVVEGPRGPYVAHKPWAAGARAGTPHETKPKDGRGPYSTPMP